MAKMGVVYAVVIAGDAVAIAGDAVAVAVVVGLAVAAVAIDG